MQLRVFLVLRGRLGYVIHTLISGISLNFNINVYVTEKRILPFYKRPGQKHNFICCLKCAGQFSSFYKYLQTKAILWKVFLKLLFI